MTDLPELPKGAFNKWDTKPDEAFYEEPRFVTHIDDGAIRAVTELYRELLPEGGRVLDLMSSWVSHLPGERSYAEVIGHGMNEQELKKNPRLTRYFLQNLNTHPRLPLESASVDAAAICASIQYLERPVDVLQDVARVLRPGSPIAISFSNRCFPTKAVAIWQVMADEDRPQLVRFYLEKAGFLGLQARRILPAGQGHDPLWAVIGWAPER